jgi:hypothetical protein
MSQSHGSFFRMTPENPHSGVVHFIGTSLRFFEPESLSSCFAFHTYCRAHQRATAKRICAIAAVVATSLRRIGGVSC